MKFTTGRCDQLHPQLMTQVARYRHKVFVEKRGWQCQFGDAPEYDQFDRVDTLYVVAQDKKGGDIIGTARLLPSSRPYWLGEVFPQLLDGLSPPCSDEVWEISRLAAVDFDAQGATAVQPVTSQVMVGLLNAALACAAAQGAKKLMAVSSVEIERLWSRAGFVMHRMGLPLVLEGRPVMACMMPVSQ